MRLFNSNLFTIISNNNNENIKSVGYAKVPKKKKNVQIYLYNITSLKGFYKLEMTDCGTNSDSPIVILYTK